MENKTEGLKTIWYFVGIVLMVMGGLVFIGGITEFLDDSPGHTVLHQLYPGIWWGAFMMLVGFVFFIKNKNKVVE
ncbi:MAG: hypothetical protein Kow0042_06280 [Calditrichia bacterium]